MKARKTFNQVGQRIEITEEVRQCLLGHKDGSKVIRNHYDDKTLVPFLKKLDKHHYELLEKFKIPEIYELMLVKLKWLVMEKNLPKWLLCQGSAHREGRKLKVLTGIQEKSNTFDTYSKRLQWTEIVEDKYRKFFIKDKKDWVLCNIKPNEFSNEILYLFKNEDYRKIIISNARKKAKSYDWSTVRKSYPKLFNKSN